MGWASRWFRGLLGGKKSAEGGTTAENRSLKEKKRWRFGKSFRERDKAQRQKDWPAKGAAAVAGEVSSEPRKGSYRETRSYAGGSPARPGSLEDGDEQSKRAIAVAAATAAVAEAAVAAAQAAAAVVRLTSSGRSFGFGAVGSTKWEEWAALKIQAAFRGYLARRALRALKGLVKLQALVRGNIVRKQAAETLRCMQALVRVQARARACRALRSETSRSSKSSLSVPGPPTPEKCESTIRSNASKPDRSGTLNRTSSKKTRMDARNKDRNHSNNWNWLDQWMEGSYWDSQQDSRVLEDDKHAKILEVDTGKLPQFNWRRRRNHHPTFCSQPKSDHSSRTLAIVPDSPSKDSTTAQLSVPCQSSSINMQESLSALRFPHVEPGDMSESPHFFSAASRPGSQRSGPFTPAKSECSRSLFSVYSDYPNYMACTESSRAKVRSQSAPKQRPECEKSSYVKRLPSHGSVLAQRSSLHAKFANKAYPGSGRLDRLGVPMRM